MIQGFGVQVLLPIVIFFMALGFRVEPSKAAKSSILIGVGFVGINLLIFDMFMPEITPLGQQMVEAVGISLPAVDVGWPAAAAIAFGVAKLGVLVIPIFVGLNLLLYVIGFTFTLDVDVWNYWHFAFIAGLVYFATNNWPLAMGMGLLLGVFVLVGADWFQPAIEETFDMTGISIPHGASLPYAIAAIPIHEVVKRIPGVGSTTWDSETIRDKFGVFGEPVSIGVILGILLGIGANTGSLGTLEAWYTILGAGITFAAAMHILPMMVGILMEGLTPLSESIRETMTSRFEDRDIAIGLDSAILIGHEATIAASLIIVPIAILMSIVLPGNDVLWGVDLATFPFLFAMMVPLMDGDVVKMVITGVILLVPVHYIAGAIAPLLTETAANAGFDTGENALITSPVADAGTPATALFAIPSQEAGLTGAYLSLVLGVVLVLAIWLALRLWPAKMYMVAGASEEKAMEMVKRRHMGGSAGILPTKIGEPIDADQLPEDVAESD
ncbi:PTS galactitol enzyme II C subunit [Halobacteriales archaeon QS_1_68_17]|nr:MAG: PTS galactitol enzyme II C subunit [Halobacteriales archaeon QS_1_68_17]